MKTKLIFSACVLMAALPGCTKFEIAKSEDPKAAPLALKSEDRLGGIWKLETTDVLAPRLLKFSTGSDGARRVDYCNSGFPSQGSGSFQLKEDQITFDYLNVGVDSESVETPESSKFTAKISSLTPDELRFDDKIKYSRVATSNDANSESPDDLCK